MPRASEFTQEIADIICERIADGESLRSICAKDEMPHTATVCRWLAQHEAFREQYARARELQADALFDEILEIADNGEDDWMERKNADGTMTGWVENGEALRRSALRVDARKWMAGKLQPKKYSEKHQLALTGADGGAVKIEAVRRVIVDPRNTDSEGVPPAA
jgi:hypothetical protein